MSKLSEEKINSNEEKLNVEHTISDIKIEDHLSDEFKNDLVKMMNKEYEKEDTNTINCDSKINRLKRVFYKNSGSSKKRFSSFRKFAIVFSLFIVISGITFGKNFTDFVAHIFSNQDKSVDLAIENGYYQNVDMDYIVHDEVGIKVDYIYADSTCIYIAFNVQTEEEFKWIYLQDMTITNENGEVIYSTDEKRVSYQSVLKKNSKKNTIILARFYSINQEFIDYSKLNIDILQVVLVKDDDDEKNIFNNWNYELAVEKTKTDNEIMYAINSEKMIKNYNIKQKNFRLNLDLEFNDSLIDNVNVSRNNIYIMDEDKKVYYCNDFYSYNHNSIKINFPIDNSNSKNFKLIIKNNENKVLIFYLYRKDG